MAGKYDKNFIEYDPKEWPNAMKMDGKGPHRMITQIDDHIARGSFFYMIHWVVPYGIPVAGIGHPPHLHKEGEFLFHIGTDSDNPRDLGGEVEMYMGEEQERHVFNRTKAIWIPGGLIHSPLKTLKCTRPFIIIQVNQASKVTQKFRLDVLPKAMRDKVDMSMIKDEGF